jgi:hypothetical protein
LWHVTQYCFTTAAAGTGGETGAGVVCGLADTMATAAAPTQPNATGKPQSLSLFMRV